MWSFKKKEHKKEFYRQKSSPTYPSTYDYSTPSTYYSDSCDSGSSGGDCGGGGD